MSEQSNVVPLHEQEVNTNGMTVSDLRQYKGQIGARVRLGADPATGYVDVEVRVSDTDPRVREHLSALRKAFRAIAADAVVAAARSRS